MSETNYIRTFTGQRLHIPPHPDEIHIDDIAHALAAAPRFGGHTRQPYSVVAHCCHVAEMLPKSEQLGGLLHDASEGYMCDLPRPIKRLLPDYTALQKQVMETIAIRFGFPWPESSLVKQADNAALYLERQALFDQLPIFTGKDENAPPASVIAYVKPPKKVKWDWELWLNATPTQLKFEFLNRFAKYRSYLLHP